MTASANTARTPVPAETPNFVLRRAVALGGILLALGGTVKVGEAIVDHGRSTGAIETLQHSGDHALADFNDGKLGKEDYTTVTVADGGTSYNQAQTIVGPDVDARQMSDIVTSQTGPEVDAGEVLVVTKDQLPKPGN